MKFLLTIFLLSTLLFAVQRQVIVGCYSIKSNAKNALILLNKKIQDDVGLQNLMQKEQLRVINTPIGDYTVVSINYFESYLHTYEIMKILKAHYDDIYSLPYPSRGIRGKEYLKDVETKFKKEANEILQEKTEEKIDVILEEEVNEMFDEETEEKIDIKPQEEFTEILQEETEEKSNVILLKSRMQGEEFDEMLEDEVPEILEENIKEELFPIREENNSTKRAEIVVKPMKTENILSEDMFENKTPILEKIEIGLSSYYIIIGIIFLFLILGGIIISRKFINKDME